MRTSYVVWQSTNIFLAIVVSYLTWHWYVREAVIAVAIWVACDIPAVVAFMTTMEHHRDQGFVDGSSNAVDA